MKESYPIYLEQQSDGKYLVNIPDFDSYTEGKNENDALKMAWDLIGAMEIKPKPFSKKYKANEKEIMYMVEIDFDEYRKSLKDVRTWEDYKKHVRETNPEIAKDIDEAEEFSRLYSQK